MKRKWLRTAIVSTSSLLTALALAGCATASGAGKASVRDERIKAKKEVTAHAQYGEKGASRDEGGKVSPEMRRRLVEEYKRTMREL